MSDTLPVTINPLFHQIRFPPLKLDLTPGFDPIIGQNNGGTRTTGGLNPYNQSKDYVLGDFVVSRGGEYFFVSPRARSLCGYAYHLR